MTKSDLWLALAGVISVSCSPALAQVKISTLPAASPITGNEAIPAVQSGVTKQTTPGQISIYTLNQIPGISPAAALTGTEAVPVVQSGSLLRSTVQALSNFFLGKIPCPQIEAFGGIGNGAADNSVALASALAASPAAHRCARLGPGVFLFSTGVTINLATAQSLTLQGGGPDVTGITFASGAGSTPFVVNYTDHTDSTHFYKLSFLAAGAGAQTAIVLNQAEQFNDPAAAAVNSMIDVSFHGSDGYLGTNYWGSAVLINEVSDFNIYSASVFGPSAPGGGWVNLGQGFVINGDVNGPEPNNYAVVYNFVGLTVTNVGEGVRWGFGVQGVNCVQCNFTGGFIAIHVLPGAPTPTTELDDGVMADGQCNVFVACIEDESGVTNWMIHGNSILVPSSTADGIFLGKNDGFVIYGNSIEPLVGSATGHAIDIETAFTSPQAYGGVITGNYISGYPVAILLGTGSRNVNVQSNAYVNVTTKVTNNGAGNTVGGGTP